MPSSVAHTDWKVSQAHVAQLSQRWPRVDVRRPELRKTIPGVRGRRISEGIKSGVWMKPLGSRPGRTYSSVRDIARSTLVVFVDGTTTGQSISTTDYEMIRDRIREIFHDRRGTMLDGELFSRIEVGDYDIDDVVSRKFDIDIIRIVSWFREDREYDVC